MLYFSDVSDVLLQSIFKLNDDEKLRYKYWLRNCPSDFKPHYYRRYVDDIFVLFTSPKHLNANMLTCHLQLNVKSRTECPF